MYAASIIALMLLSQTTDTVEADSEASVRRARLEAFAKRGIEQVLSRALDAPVTVGEVVLPPSEEGLELHNVRVGNPSGFQGDTALSAETVRVDADVKSLLSREPEIRVVRASGVQVNAESRLPQGSNIAKLLQNAKQSKREGPLREKTQKRWRIQKAVLEGAKVKVDAPMFQKQAEERTLKDIEMSFGGEDGRGVPAQQAVAQFMARLLQELEIRPGSATETGTTPESPLLDLFNRIQSR